MVMLESPCARACMLSHFSHVWLFVTPRPPWTVARQAPLSMGFSRQEYWSGMPCPPSGDLPNPGIKPYSPVAPAVQVDSLPLSHQGSTLESPYKWPQMEEAVHLLSQWASMRFLSVLISFPQHQAGHGDVPPDPPWRPAFWVHNHFRVQCVKGPRAQFSMWCCHLEILSNFEQGPPQIMQSVLPPIWGQRHSFSPLPGVLANESLQLRHCPCLKRTTLPKIELSAQGHEM